MSTARVTTRRASATASPEAYLADATEALNRLDSLIARAKRHSDREARKSAEGAKLVRVVRRAEVLLEEATYALVTAHNRYSRGVSLGHIPMTLDRRIDKLSSIVKAFDLSRRPFRARDGVDR